jgi:hypothetical protein
MARMTSRPRLPQFTDQTLKLFRALEATPVRRRRTQEFKDGAHQLARLLEQTDEYWTGNSVLDRGRPCHPVGYIATVHWARCRTIRKALLEALKRSVCEAQPVDEKAFPAP